LDDSEYAASKLKSEGVSLVFVKDGRVVYQSWDHGIKPFIDAIRLDLEELRGASVADRVVGRAAALLSVYTDVSSVYALKASSKAMEVLKAHGVKCGYEQMVEQILDREGRDICPFEKAVLHIDAPEDAFRLLEEKIYPRSGSSALSVG